MKSYRIAIVALATILFIFAGGTASAQQTVNLTPDDRFGGYHGPKIVWPTTMPDLNACKAEEYYEPADTHLIKYVVNAASTRIQQHDECRWEDTRKGWRWVLRPAGTIVAVDAKGRDLYDYGSKSGKKCANPSPFGIPIVPPEIPPPPPPKVEEVPKPAPAAAPTCSISGDRISGFVGAATGGEGRWWFDGTEQVSVGDQFKPSSLLKSGIHVAEFRVTGPGGQVTCERKFDIFAPLTPIVTATPPSRPEPEVKKPRRKWPLLVAIVAAGVIIYATRGEEQKPAPLGNKPPVGVISPARAGEFSFRF